MKAVPAVACDFYKTGHHKMEPEGLSLVFNNMTPRSNKIAKSAGIDAEEIISVGHSYYIQDFLIDKWNNEFFNVPKEQAIRSYKRRMDTSLGPNAVDVSALEELHDLGYLPIEIYALPEGTRTPIRVAPMVTYDTHRKFAWIVNYLESIQSCYLWMPSTNATIADAYYRLFEQYAEETVGDTSFVPFQGHDFSFRGMSSYQSAIVSGMAHLMSGFVGTDTIPAIDNLEHYYKANADEELIGCSVPASEHSIACLNIAQNERKNGVDKRTAELQFLDRYLDLFPTGIASYVSDTYDYWKLVTDIVPALKDKILARDGKLVIRPDSGDPVDIVCGTVKFVFSDIESAVSQMASYHYDKADNACEGSCCFGLESYETVAMVGDKFFKFKTNFEYDRHDKTYYYIENYSETVYEEVEPTPEMKGSIQCLWETFGGTVTEKGYKQLDSHIGLIYGDSITLQRAKEILWRLKEKGFASTNIVFGIGSFTYQYNTRDTFGFAVKATYGVIDDEPIEVYKDPKTDSGTKKSAKGLISVDYVDGKLVQTEGVDWEDVQNCEYQLIFSNGVQYNAPSLAEIRKRVRGG